MNMRSNCFFSQITAPIAGCTQDSTHITTPDTLVWGFGLTSRAGTRISLDQFVSCSLLWIRWRYTKRDSNQTGTYENALGLFLGLDVANLCRGTHYTLLSPLPSTGYTFFALFEYLVVVSNMAFHLTAYWDFKGREVMVISPSEYKDFWLERTRVQVPSVRPLNLSILVRMALNPVQREEEWKVFFSFFVFPWWHLVLENTLKCVGITVK